MTIDEEVDVARRQMAQAHLDLETYSEGTLINKALFNELLDRLRIASTEYLSVLNRQMAIKYDIAKIGNPVKAVAEKRLPPAELKKEPQ